MRESINQHEVQYFDLHLSQIGQDVRYGFLGKIHVAIVEASDLTDDGEIILSTSVGYLAYPTPGGRTGYHRAE